jgi:Tol biopolymer transport system component
VKLGPQALQRTTFGALCIVVAAIAAVGCGDASATSALLSVPAGATQASWAPDGSLLALPAHDRIEMVKPDGSVERRVEVPGIDLSALSCECEIGWSKDGTRLHLVTRPEDARAAIVTVEADGSGSPRRAPLDMHVGGAAWSPNGWPLIFIPDSVTYPPPKGDKANPDLWRLDGLDAKPRKILAQPGTEAGPAFAPDGRRLLYTRIHRGRAEIWVVGADGSEPRRLVGGLLIVEASWSPDGKTIALAATRDGKDRRTHLFLVPAAGGKLRQVGNEEILCHPPAWSPDGRWIAYANYAGQIRRIHPGGGGAETLRTLPENWISGLKWSPRGRPLAYTARPMIEPS